MLYNWGIGLGSMGCLVWVAIRVSKTLKPQVNAQKNVSGG